jgi:hypothetical protein
MMIAGGLLLMMLAFVLGQARPLRFGAVRCAAFAGVLLFAWWRFKQPREIGLIEAFRDWVYILPVAAVGVAQRLSWITPARANATLLAAAGLLGVVSFGTFNPIQSTVPIFAKHDTPITYELDRRMRLEGRGYILLKFGTSFFAHSGLSLVGLGYPSLSYSTFDPAMDLWAKLYPDLPPETREKAFHNAGSIGFGDVPEPKWVPIFLLAPMAPFTKPGVTVCDIIRPSRARFAPLAGCPAQPARATQTARPGSQ